MSYDVGAIVRQLTDFYVHARPPRVTPRQLQPLITMLETVTAATQVHAQAVEAWLSERKDTIDTGELWPQYTQAKSELQAWQLRLGAYRLSVDTCAADNDADCTLWTVVAPLFFGYYGGPLSTEPQRLNDISTPFRIGNQLTAIVAAKETANVEVLIADVKQASSGLASTVGDATVGAVRVLGDAASTVGAAAGGVAGGLLSGLTSSPGGMIALALVGGGVLWWLFGRPKEVAA